MASGTAALDLFNVVIGKTLSIFLVCCFSLLIWFFYAPNFEKVEGHIAFTLFVC